jgi:hypothetical protein
MLTDMTTDPTPSPANGGGSLVSYVMDRVQRWRQFRDGNYEKKWKQYEGIYRGEWTAALQVKKAERSRVITPATTNAVDQAVSEIVEAIFGRGSWFDIDEDGKSDQEIQIAAALQKQLLEDLHNDGIKAAIIGTVHNGCVFGTGIIKRVIDSEVYETFQTGADGEMQRNSTDRAYLCWEPVKPQNFVIDSAATCIKDAHGVAHETLRPKHEVEAKQRKGIYFEGAIGSAAGFGSADVLTGPDGANYSKDPQDGVYITEYHGLVPRWMLEDATEEKEPEDPLDAIAEDSEEDEPSKDDLDLVEALVTIGNGSTLLKAVENPILNHDRGFIAYQHYVVPNQFWGQGIPEKAFNSQSALDGEIRARMDTLALITYPSITVDATRIPKQLNLEVAPGKVYRTNGRGSEIIEPLKFGNLDPQNFQSTQDLERYVQLATGATDPATPVNQRSGGGTASGASMSFGSYIKRSKLPMQTIDEQLLDPLVQKSLLGYMTIDPDRYPALFDYTVNSTLSIMAREFEQANLTNLMALLPQGSPEYQTVLKAIITNYSGPAKAQLLADIEKAMAPDPMKQQMQQIQVQTASGQLDKLHAEIAKLQAEATYTGSKPGTESKKLELTAQQQEIEAAQTMVGQRKVAVAEQQAHHQLSGHLLGALGKIHGANKQHESAKLARKATS